MHFVRDQCLQVDIPMVHNTFAMSPVKFEVWTIFMSVD